MDSEKISIFDVANFYRSKEKMTHKKLQKMVYYAYVQYILEYNTTNNITNFLFEDQPEAWIHGPVFPRLYQQYKQYNWKEIPKLLFYNPNFEYDVIELLNRVWDRYGGYSADQLEYMTHCDAPWQEARQNLNYDEYSNSIISPESIFNFYILR